MRRIRRLAKALGNFFLRSRAEREMNRELAAHLRLMADEFERRGYAPEDAARAARLSMGGIEQTRELHRAARSFVWFEQTAQDLRYAVRGLLRSPGFTLLAILTLALGIGVNTALFSTYNAAALKPMPVRDPDRVVRFERWFESLSAGTVQYAFSLPEFNYCVEHGDRLGYLVAASWLVAVKGPATHRRVVAQFVSPNYFEELGIPLFAGRGFRGEPAGTPAVVASYRYWRQALGSDPAAVGRTVALNNAVFTIIGVTAEEFTGTSVNPETPDLWAPLSAQRTLVPGQDWPGDPELRELQIFARLPATVNAGIARAQAEVLIRRFDKSRHERDPTTAVRLTPTSYFPNADDARFRVLVAAVMLVVGLILFVACVNVGNMVLARGAARQREVAARLALGAGRGRIVRQLLTESLLLSLFGGIAGLAASIWATRLLTVVLAANAGFVGGDIAAVNMSPDARVLGYNFAIALASGILFGLSPALKAARQGLAAALKNDSGLAAGPFRLRGLLVSAQVAVSILLLATAGLLARGMIRARRAEPGFDTKGIYVAAGGYGSFRNNPAAATERMKNMAERLRQLPEVKSAATGSVPFTGTWTPHITAGSTASSTLASYASDTYTDVVGLPILHGRGFLPEENASNAPVAMVSESAARAFWPGADPVGRRFTLDMNFRGKLKTFEVVGVVSDIRFANLTRVDPAHVYLCGQGEFPGSVLLRLNGDPRRSIAAVEKSMNAGAPDVQDARLVNLETGFVGRMRELSSSLASFAAALAVFALTLAGIGIYGVIAYVVGQRTKEIGVRMALGADGNAVLAGVVLQALRPVMAGIACGIGLAALLSALLHRTLIFPGSMDLFYGVPFYDPLTFAALIVFALLMASAASFAPARRALAVDPMIALRYE